MAAHPSAPGSTRRDARRLISPAMKPVPHAIRSVRRSATRAFTLMEILVVLAIVGLLVGLAVTNVGNIFSGSQKDIAKLFVNQSMQAPLNAYRIHLGDFPTTAEGLQALITAPANKADRWRGPYLQESKLPVDPWGELYQYRFPGMKNKSGYDLWSKGPDKTDGTEDDIGNW
jgi:general secretion pathway protein G